MIDTARNRLLTEREDCFDSNVKKAKTKHKKGSVRGSVERRIPYQKAATRSSAFTRALLNAGAIRIGCAHFLKKPPKKWLRFRKSHSKIHGLIYKRCCG